MKKLFSGIYYYFQKKESQYHQLIYSSGMEDKTKLERSRLVNRIIFSSLQLKYTKKFSEIRLYLGFIC